MEYYKRKSAYIYPNSSKKNKVNNPYLINFMDSMGKNIDFLNREDPTTKGIFDITKYIWKVDYIFLNWTENLPEKKGGIFQILFLIVLLSMKKLLKTKIIWTMHNKVSHTNNKLFLKKLIFKMLLINSDVIITHSKEGIKFAKSMVEGSENKIIYRPHPITKTNLKPSFSLMKDYDIIIWGTLNPYKGIHNFLSYLKENIITNPFKILIIGKPISSEYYKTLNSYRSENCEIIGDYLDMDELSNLINRSKIILFTYSENSVLSSGALMDSISFHGCVVGPDIGAFADLAELGIVKTYKNFSDLLKILETEISTNDNKNSNREIEIFIEENTWEKFADNLIPYLITN